MEEDHEEVCDMGLGLSIGVGDHYVRKQKNKRVACLDLSFPKEEEAMDSENKTEGSSSKTVEEGEAYEKIDSNEAKNKNCSRKKLRLTKEQTSMLEDSFKLRTTLNTIQKQALAERLNLTPRQVEVWFQNRRARTKLKQTEVDCEFLKKCCESLSDENRRLKKELQELVSLKPPLFIQLPKAATLTMCPSCDKIVKVGGGGDAKEMVHEP